VTSAKAQALPVVSGTLQAQRHGAKAMARGRTVTASSKVKTLTSINRARRLSSYPATGNWSRRLRRVTMARWPRWTRRPRGSHRVHRVLRIIV